MLARRWLISVAVLYLGLASAAWAQQGVRWQPNLESARRLAAQTNRLLLVHFWTETCQPCMRMDNEVFSLSQVAAAIEANYVPVKVNVRQYPVTAQQFGVTSWPTDLVMTAQGKVIDKNVGFVAAEQYVGRLNQIAAAMKNPPANGYVQSTASPPIASQAPSGVAGAAPGAGRPGASASPSSSVAAAGSSQQGYSVPPWNQGGDSPNRQPAPTSATDPRFSGMATDPRGAQPYRPADPQAGGVADRRGPTSGADPQGPAGSPQDRPARPSAGNPPLALDGYCTVTLSEKEQWVRGNPRFGVIHAGRTYLFVGQTEARRFYDTPERFAPANGGNDVVAMAERSQTVAGRREFGGFYEGRVYLFASEDSYQKFTQDPGRYVGAAVNPSAATVQRGDATPPSGPSAGSPDWSNPRGASPGLPPDGQMPPSGGYEGAIRSQPPAGRF